MILASTVLESKPEKSGITFDVLEILTWWCFVATISQGPVQPLGEGHGQRGQSKNQLGYLNNLEQG